MQFASFAEETVLFGATAVENEFIMEYMLQAPGDFVRVYLYMLFQCQYPQACLLYTSVNLLMRFYDIDSGVIRIDGEDIRHYKRQDLRDSLGMVLQDVYMFAGTVRDNIAYGKLDATDEEIVRAAKAANCHDFIMRLPKGYNTDLAEDAANLSQGQRQLLSIARAILANPAVLILDEATSSVDTRTEMNIQQEMCIRDRLCYMGNAHTGAALPSPDVAYSSPSST